MSTRLDAERWREVIPYLDRALDLPAEERTAWLAALRGQDPALAEDLTALLDRHDALEQEGFLGEGVGAAPPSRASLAGQVVGAYTLRSRLGQGGMGSVWLAERTDGRFQGVVAVKLLNASLVGDDGEARFRQEGSILARLRHPHIAHLIDAGVSLAGSPYLVLERVDGDCIDLYCDERRLSVDARIRLFLDVLAAVAHAHVNLVVHRDLKPSNVMVDASAQVKLLDFGIAKLLQGEGPGAVSALTREGRQALTPEYAAPEQLTGGDVTTATDVYALGVLLYVILTGRHPAGCGTGSPADLIRAVVDTEPQPASDAVTAEAPTRASQAEIATCRATTSRKLRAALRGDVDRIVAKALKKRPEERYGSAEAMADDLRRHLAHLPVLARGDSLGYRARKFAARNSLALSAAAVVLAALLTGAGVAVWQARTAARERDRALVQLQRAEATNDLSSFLLSEATPSMGRPITNAELLARGEALIDRVFASDPTLRAHMLLTLADRYQENQQFDRWRQTVERAFDLSRGIADSGLRARAACAKAAGLAESGDGAAAMKLLDETLLRLAASPDAAADEARCRVFESIAARLQGNDARAVVAAERALALEEARPGPAGRELDALNALSTAYAAVGQFKAADAISDRVVALLDAHGRGETRMAAVVLNNRSAVLQDAGQHLAAVDVAERAVRIARSQDTDNGASLSQLTTYGGALLIVGRARESVPLFDEAVAKARRAGSPRRLSFTLGSAATAYRDTGDPDTARRLLLEAEAVLKSDTGAGPQHYAVLDRHLSRQALAAGDVKAAAELAARAVAAVVGASSRSMVGYTLALAETQNAAGRFDEARVTAQRSLEMSQGLLGGMTHSYNLGRSHLDLGIALAGQGHIEDAQAELRQALAHLEASVGREAPSTRRARTQTERLGS